MIEALNLSSCIFNHFHLFFVHSLNFKMLLQSSSLLFIHFLLSQFFDFNLCQINLTIILNNFGCLFHLKISFAVNKHEKETLNANNAICMEKNKLINNVLIDVIS